MNYIDGLFSNLLMKCANWFLYIFIAPNADLPSKVMEKRSRQIAILQKIDKWNIYYNYDQLVKIVFDGIVKRYGKTPAEMLELIYKNSTSVNSIGLVVEYLPDDDEIKMLDTYTDNKGNIFDSKTDKLVRDSTGKVYRQSGDLWKDIASVIEWFVEILNKIRFNSSTYRTANPSQTDWYYDTGYKQNAGLTQALPVVIGGVVLYYLFTKSKTKK